MSRIHEMQAVNQFAEVIAAIALEFGNGYKCDGADFVTMTLSRDTLKTVMKGYVRVDVSDCPEDDRIIINVIHDRRGRSFQELLEMFDEFMNK